MLRFAAFFAVLSCAAGPASADDLQPILATAMHETMVPGAGVLVIRNGKVDAVAVRGVRELGKPEPVQPDDRWQIGSDTKPMTATLILRLVGEIAETGIKDLAGKKANFGATYETSSSQTRWQTPRWNAMRVPRNAGSLTV